MMNQYRVTVHSDWITEQYRVLADNAQHAEVLACKRFQREHPAADVDSVSAAYNTGAAVSTHHSHYARSF